MSAADLIAAGQIAFALFFISLNVGYLVLVLIASAALKRYRDGHPLGDLPASYSGFEPPVSILAPAYNEEATIGASVKAMLQLDYPDYEVIVINDGSKDGTLDALKREFDLVQLSVAPWPRIPSAKVRAVYASRPHPNLRIIDKENGGKADALNAGINASRCGLFCAVDADSILERDSLRRVIEPFLDEPRTIVSGGTIRIANGCEVTGGHLTKIGLPSNALAMFQVVEYLRAFLFGRMGWSPLNAVLIISGAFGVFRKEAVVNVGGYRHKTIGEDMELIVRLHRHYRMNRLPYRITFVADPVCWTEAPETTAVLKNQRVRWQRGLCESLTLNLGLLCHPRGGAAGWLAFPFLAIFEWMGPLVELAGYVFLIVAWLFGAISGTAFLLLMALALSLGMLLSVAALMLEEAYFHIYEKPSHTVMLVLTALLENFGYRQVNTAWRLIGMYKWATGAKNVWGTMTRTATWSKPGS